MVKIILAHVCIIVFLKNVHLKLRWLQTEIQRIVAGMSALTGAAASGILVAWCRHELRGVRATILGDMLRAVPRC